MNRNLSTICFVFLVSACEHPLEIIGEGDIVSASGSRDCSLEEQPCPNPVVNDYLETYDGQARDGFEFVGWDGCGTPSGASCLYDVPASVVNQFWLQTMPPLVAKFAPNCINAPASSFAAIQEVIFSRCTGCHGSNGGLSLAPATAYANIVNVDSTQTNLLRIEPGSPETSYLYQKVFEKANPGSFMIQGEGMPRAGAALSDDHLEALAIWITEGAPETGRANELKEVEQLLGLCD
ncbi:MAG: hypothetical protein ACR2PS_01285 [Pseudomonadales bacterium]